MIQQSDLKALAILIETTCTQHPELALAIRRLPKERMRRKDLSEVIHFLHAKRRHLELQPDTPALTWVHHLLTHFDALYREARKTEREKYLTSARIPASAR